MPRVETTPEAVAATYARTEATLAVVRRRLGRALTLAEKVVLGHLDDPEGQELERGEAYLQLRPDRVALQDATAQMALLQFMLAGKQQVAVPTTVHCDHLIQARVGASADLQDAILENNEVYNFLRTAAAKYGAGFWKAGSGIIHQVVLENYAFPGGLMIGTDSHTPNAGGLGMCAIGVGGADAVDVMAGFPWEVLQPNLVGVKLVGELSGWTAPKDVILWLLGQLTVKGGTNRIIEYFGPGVAALSCTGKGTITNMGAELGATTSMFPYDARMEAYLRATDRAGVADLANQHRHLLTADPEVEANPEDHYDIVLELDLSTLEPHLVGPHTPDLAWPISKMAAAVESEGYPDELPVVLIGSCTNSSYEDICRAADVAQQAIDHGATMRSKLLVTPGSDKIMATIQRDGQMATLEAVGASVLANACGPCIGQWRRTGSKEGEANSIVTSFNRNFPGRNDANPSTLAFIGSPELVVALGLAGRLSFNPLTDALPGDGNGQGEWRLDAPGKAPELPAAGFAEAGEGFLAPVEDGSGVAIEVDPESKRLALLDPFTPRSAEQLSGMPLLLKTKGKTTTDHISPAGYWLRFRGHLDAISDNMFSGAINAFTGERGLTRPRGSAEGSEEVHKVARAIKAGGASWVVVGDENYGEGSSREHAAMSPRLLGAGAVIARSFARIAESNLKKQAVLPLTFADAADYEKVRDGDHVTVEGLEALSPDVPVTVRLDHADGSTDRVTCEHTLNADQVRWFFAGSALNLLRQQAIEG
jgi:aconitate hydratase